VDNNSGGGEEAALAQGRSHEDSAKRWNLILWVIF